MSHSYKLEFTLKQHTPIIHFQHNQAGATLRASEVKPRLDRFIWGEWIKIEGNERAAFQKYQHLLIGECDFEKNFIGQRYRALNYKVKIKPVENNPPEPDYPGFFSNMGPEGRVNPKLGLIDHGLIEMNIFSFNQLLIESIKKFLPRFIATNNFGNRKTKGFGSFEVKKFRFKDEFFVPNTATIIKNNAKCYNCITVNSDDLYVIFSVITQYWANLKSGINFNTYKPSFYRDYLKSSDPQKHWEKRWLKEKFLDLPSDENDKEYHRAWMGLQSSYEFKKLDKSVGNVRSGSNMATVPSFFEKIELQVVVSNAVVKRITAPVLFKPIIENGNASIYIIIEPLNNEQIETLLCNDSFNFTPKYKVKRANGQQVRLTNNEQIEYDIFRNAHSMQSLKIPDYYPELKSILYAFHEHLEYTFDVSYMAGRRLNTITAAIEDL